MPTIRETATVQVSDDLPDHRPQRRRRNRRKPATVIMVRVDVIERAKQVLRPGERIVIVSRTCVETRPIPPEWTEPVR